jgi:hypothetical protein
MFDKFHKSIDRIVSLQNGDISLWSREYQDEKDALSKVILDYAQSRVNEAYELAAAHHEGITLDTKNKRKAVDNACNDARKKTGKLTVYFEL